MNDYKYDISSLKRATKKFLKVSSKRKKLWCTKECYIELLARRMRQNGTETTVGKLTEALEKLDIRNAANNLISGKEENSGFPVKAKFFFLLRRSCSLFKSLSAV